MFDRDTQRGALVASDIGGVFCEVDVTSDEKVAAAFNQARSSRPRADTGHCAG